MKRILFIFLCLEGCFFDSNYSEICFIGDSITQQWDIERSFPGYAIKKHAKIGARISDVFKWDIDECQGIPTVILIGTNDIGHLTAKDSTTEKFQDFLTQKYVSLAKKINANPLFVISILPRNYKEQQDPSVNQNIEQQNQIIKDSINAMNIDYYFIDVFNFFLSKKYQIDENLFYDGLHPNAEGYELLTKQIQKYL